MVFSLSYRLCIGTDLFITQFKDTDKFNIDNVRIRLLSHSVRQITTNLLFERGCRNHWLYNPSAAKVLMVFSGEAYY